MVFNSLQYLFFLPITFFLFYFSRQRYRWVILLAASLAFYSALQLPVLLLALAFVIAISYFSGLWLGVAKDARQKKSILIAGICLNLLPLFILRYLPALLQAAYHQFAPALKIPDSSLVRGITAVGVSFFVFQAISYLIDIDLEVIQPERHFGLFALSLSFFPKIMQGPIERSGDLLPQLHKSYQFDYQNTRGGLLQIGWGLFKKLVLADRFALFVNPVFNNVHEYSGLSLILATYLYAFQIYFDFSAYTDIALGTARLFNINLTQNFNQPYLAVSIADFWRRWHISFSRWILDYIFKPLQMQWRSWKFWGTTAALLITFLASGIWHGASWGFVIWGLLHGLFLSLEVLSAPLEKSLLKRFRISKSQVFKAWKVFVTFNLVCFTWIFFRANTISDAFYVVSHLFSGLRASARLLSQSLVSAKALQEFIKPLMLGQSSSELNVLLVILASYAVLAVLQSRMKGKQLLTNQPMPIRWAVYYLLVIIALLFGVYGQSQFIYFQF